MLVFKETYTLNTFSVEDMKQFVSLAESRGGETIEVDNGWSVEKCCPTITFSVFNSKEHVTAKEN